MAAGRLKKVSKRTTNARNSGNGRTIAEDLEHMMIDELLQYQQMSDGQSDIRRQLRNLLSPSKSVVFVLAQRETARMAVICDKISAAKSAGETYPWIVAPCATILFESAFQASVAVWLAAGEPSSTGLLKPRVADFVHASVKGLAMIIGAK